MNFSSLLNHDEPNAAPESTTEPQPSTRMSFDYLNSEQNMTPAGGSPAFFSTPSEFVGDSDGEGTAYSGTNEGMMADHQFPTDTTAFMGSQDLYQHPQNTVQPPVYPHFPQYPQYPQYNPFPHSSLPPQTSTSPHQALPPYAFSPFQHSQQAVSHLPIPPPTFSTTEGASEADDEKPQKSAKARGKGKAKGKAKGDVDGQAEGNDMSSAVKPSAARPSKTKGASKSKRNALLVASNHSSPAPSPGPSTLSNEVRFDSQELDDQEERRSLVKPHKIESDEPQKTLKPLTTSHLKSAIVPSTTSSLSSAFKNYISPRIGPGGAPLTDSEDDEDEDAARKRVQARRAATLAAKGKSRARTEEEEREESDDRLYCVCRELYDPERMMIACDRCEEWYHIDCVGIRDDGVELVDQFFCPPCQAKYHQRTTWLEACSRPTCQKPAVALSKYCSDYCGISVVSARLELLKLANGTDPSAFWGRVEGARRTEAKVVEATRFPSTVSEESLLHRQSAEDSRTLSRLQNKLEETNSRRAGLLSAISMVEKRLLYLKIAIKRWEALCQATADELNSAGISVAGGGGSGTTIEAKPTGAKRGGKKKGKVGKKKGPVAATSLPEAQCGLDVRLVYDDQTWRDWVDSVSIGQDRGGEEGEEEGGKRILEAKERGDDQQVLDMALEMLDGVCLQTRKKCERHTGWQKVREADFQVEKAVLTRRLDRLSTLSRSLESQISLHQQATAFRLSNRTRATSTTTLIPIDDFMEEQEILQPRAKPVGPRNTGRRSTSPVMNRGSGYNVPPSFNRGDFVAGGEDGEANLDVPAELLPFLSRAEIAKLKAQHK